jgi:predicted DNA-binding transcriptional regulator YafY
MAAIPTRHEVALLLEAPVSRVEAVVGHWGTVEPLEDGRCRLRMSVDDLGWPVMVLGVVGAPFVVESPLLLRERVRATGELLLSSLD